MYPIIWPHQNQVDLTSCEKTERKGITCRNSLKSNRYLWFTWSVVHHVLSLTRTYSSLSSVEGSNLFISFRLMSSRLASRSKFHSFTNSFQLLRFSWSIWVHTSMSSFHSMLICKSKNILRYIFLSLNCITQPLSYDGRKELQRTCLLKPHQLIHTQSIQQLKKCLFWITLSATRGPPVMGLVLLQEGTGVPGENLLCLEETNWTTFFSHVTEVTLVRTLHGAGIEL